MPQRESAADVEDHHLDSDEAGTSRETRDGQPSRRTIVFVIAAGIFAVACVVVALQFFVAERLPELTDAKLEAAAKLWQDSGPASYNIDIELRGAQPGMVHVVVVNRVVTETTRNGRVPPQWTWDTWSVPGMFDTLTQDLQIARNPETEIQAPRGTKWRLRCQFDSEFGFPQVYHRLVTGGPEVFWRVTNFQPK